MLKLSLEKQCFGILWISDEFFPLYKQILSPYYLSHFCRDKSSFSGHLLPASVILLTYGGAGFHGDFTCIHDQFNVVIQDEVSSALLIDTVKWSLLNKIISIILFFKLK